MTFSNTPAIAGLAAALLLATGTAAKAQDDGNFLILGLGASLEPVFPGSDEMAIAPEPIIEARYGRFFIGELGLGVDIFSSDGPTEFTVGTAIGLGEGRDEGDDSDFKGLGDVDQAIELALFAEAEWRFLEFGAAVVTDVGSGHGGTYLTLGVGFENDLTDRLSYEVELSTIYGDSNYVDTLYGVSRSQAARSRYNEFSPGAGFTEASLDLSLRYAITENWFAEGGVGVGTLLGNARDAPFLQRDTFTSASIGVGRVFRF